MTDRLQQRSRGRVCSSETCRRVSEIGYTGTENKTKLENHVRDLICSFKINQVLDSWTSDKARKEVMISMCFTKLTSVKFLTKISSPDALRNLS